MIKIVKMKKQIKSFLGIDVSKPYFDVSLLQLIKEQKTELITERFTNNVEGIKLWHQWLKSNHVSFNANSLLVIENTGIYHRLIWNFCSTLNLPIHIGNAAHIKWSLGITRGKNDKIDSQRLCKYCFKQADELKATAALNPVLLQLKDLFTTRTKLLTHYNSSKTYLDELKSCGDKATYQLLCKNCKAALNGIKKSIKEIEATLKQIIASDPTIQNNLELIKTVPGVGDITAIYIICCTNNFANKISGKQLASYAGVVPFEHSSGISVRGKNREHKMANKDLKKLLHLCALSAIKYYPEFTNYYNRKKEEGKNGMVVLNAIRNKIILRVAAVVNNQQPYVNNYKNAS
jgi:transposase